MGCLVPLLVVLLLLFLFLPFFSWILSSSVEGRIPEIVLPFFVDTGSAVVTVLLAAGFVVGSILLDDGMDCLLGKYLPGSLVLKELTLVVAGILADFGSAVGSLGSSFFLV